MPRKHCNNCNKLLGEISKGKMLKTTIYLCNSCFEQLTTKAASADLMYKEGDRKNNDMPDFFKDMFNLDSNKDNI